MTALRNGSAARVDRLTRVTRLVQQLVALLPADDLTADEREVVKSLLHELTAMAADETSYALSLIQEARA